MGFFECTLFWGDTDAGMFAEAEESCAPILRVEPASHGRSEES